MDVGRQRRQNRQTAGKDAQRRSRQSLADALASQPIPHSHAQSATWASEVQDGYIGVVQRYMRDYGNVGATGCGSGAYHSLFRLQG